MSDPNTQQTSSTNSGDREKITELIKGIRVAMVTTVDADGALVSRPMATQDVEFDGNLWFIAERDSSLAQTVTSSDARVNVAYAGNGGWVSVAGVGRLVDDRAKLEKHWGLFTDTWMEGGPENPQNVLIKVEADSAEYWGSPGSKVTRLADFARSVATGERPSGESGTVDL